jgi:hypothetical protein
MEVESPNDADAVLQNVADIQNAAAVADSQSEWADMEFVHEIRRRAGTLENHLKRGIEEKKDTTLGSYQQDDLIDLIAYLQGGADFLEQNVIHREDQRHAPGMGERHSVGAAGIVAAPGSNAMKRFVQMLRDYHQVRMLHNL